MQSSQQQTRPALTANKVTILFTRDQNRVDVIGLAAHTGKGSTSYRILATARYWNLDRNTACLSGRLAARPAEA